MKKKIISLCLVVALGATAVIGGTLAYFTDTDSAKNVMTTGTVNILQNEKKQDGTDFADNIRLMPMVDKREEGDAVVENGFFNAKMKNVVDKIVTVTNEAKEGEVNKEAYVRTILAFETNTEYKANTDEVLRDGKKIFDDYIGTLGSFELLKRDTIEVNGVEYVLAVEVYEDALEPTKTTEPSLKQIFLAPSANNEVEHLFGTEYTILALSQATQVAGFDNAADALDTVFGNLETIDEATLIEWLSAVA